MRAIKSVLRKYSKIDEKYIKISMDIAAQISAYLKEKRWNQAKFAKKMNKKESEISKWLSGTHNFTVKTLALIEATLDKDLFLIPLDINENISVENGLRTSTRIYDYNEIRNIIEGFGLKIIESDNLYNDKKEITGNKISNTIEPMDHSKAIIYNFT